MQAQYVLALYCERLMSKLTPSAEPSWLARVVGAWLAGPANAVNIWQALLSPTCAGYHDIARGAYLQISNRQHG